MNGYNSSSHWAFSMSSFQRCRWLLETFQLGGGEDRAELPTSASDESCQSDGLHDSEIASSSFGLTAMLRRESDNDIDVVSVEDQVCYMAVGRLECFCVTNEA